MDNQCRDCEKPIPSYEERCPQCWRELDHEAEYPDEEFNQDG